jgi:Cu+-exporting ATPase
LEIQSLQNNTDDLSILASLESLSSHPIAQAILDYAKQNKLKIQQVQDFKNLP